MKRAESRECAFTILFEAGFEAEFSPIGAYEKAIETRGVADDKYVRRILNGVEAHLTTIDEAITGAALGWKRERISHVSMAILRLAAYEMFYEEDVPLRVSLNEAIELSKKYDDEKAYGFVNGVLNALMHDERAVGEK